MKDRYIKIIKHSLLIFVYISIGFAIGKHYGHGRLDDAPSSGAEVKEQPKVYVYYMHGTNRCYTCNKLEKMTFNVLESNYKDSLSDGSIKWMDVDYLTDHKLAERFDVTSGCVVVALQRGDKVIDYRRLDRIWELKNDPEGFNDYISSAIREINNGI